MVTKLANKWKIAAGLSLACAACCAPLFLTLFMGAGGAGLVGGAAGGMLGASWAEIVCVAMLAALAVGAIVLLVRAWARRKRVAECACPSVEVDGASCTVGGKCDPSAG